MTNNKPHTLSLIDALCIVKIGYGTQQERELGDHAYLVVKQHSEKLHLEYKRQCIDEKLDQINKTNGDGKQSTEVEKAKELVEKMTKQYALFLVDEILKNFGTLTEGKQHYAAHCTIQFYEQVKQEIENYEQ